MITFTNTVRGGEGKISVSNSHTLHDDWIDIHEIIEGFRLFLLSSGFHPETVKANLGAD